MYLIRLDDACEYMDVEKWDRIEKILEKYDVKPLVGIIPACEDPKIKELYPKDESFWEKEKKWEKKGWTIAMHGYQHLYVTNQGGLNPVNHKSEFAGLSLEEQKYKIRKGIRILKDHNIYPRVFFAPSHTFDENTLQAIKEESSISIISDTISSNVYYRDGFWYVPQQSGSCRKLPVRVATFCFHPNTMKDTDYCNLESFIAHNKDSFTDFTKIDFTDKRQPGVYDTFLRISYFMLRIVRNRIRQLDN